MADLLVLLDDESLCSKLTALSGDTLPVEGRFAFVFDLRTRLVVSKRVDQKFIVNRLNEPIALAIKYRCLMSDEMRTTFVSSFARCMLRLNYEQHKLSLEHDGLPKANYIKNAALNFGFDLIETIKGLSNVNTNTNVEVSFAPLISFILKEDIAITKYLKKNKSKWKLHWSCSQRLCIAGAARRTSIRNMTAAVTNRPSR